MVFLRHLRIFGAVVIAGLLAASCVGLPLDSSWGDISLIGSTPNIMLAFSDKIVQVDPTDGTLINLLDANGNVRVDEAGKPRPWQVQVTGGSPTHFYTRPIQLDTDTLLAADYESKLLEIDPTRAEVTSPAGVTLPGHVVGNPLLTETALYVPLSDGGLVALNPTDWSQIWHFTSDDGKGVWSQPLLLDGTMYVSSMNHFLYALDPAEVNTDQTPVEKWNLDLEGAIASSPTYANDALYVGSFAHKIFKVSLDGSIVAEFPTNGWVWGAPAVADDMVYVADLAGYIYALRDTGSALEEVWSRKVANGAIRMMPLVSGDTLVVGSRDHFVYWIDRQTGEEIRKQETRGEVLSDILLIGPNDAVREPTIVVSTLAPEELLVAFSLDSGDRRWVYPHSS